MNAEENIYRHLETDSEKANQYRNLLVALLNVKAQATLAQENGLLSHTIDRFILETRQTLEQERKKETKESLLMAPRLFKNTIGMLQFAHFTADHPLKVVLKNVRTIALHSDEKIDVAADLWIEVQDDRN